MGRLLWLLSVMIFLFFLLYVYVFAGQRKIYEVRAYCGEKTCTEPIGKSHVTYYLVFYDFISEQYRVFIVSGSSVPEGNPLATGEYTTILVKARGKKLKGIAK